MTASDSTLTPYSTAMNGTTIGNNILISSTDTSLSTTTESFANTERTDMLPTDKSGSKTGQTVSPIHSSSPFKTTNKTTTVGTRKNSQTIKPFEPRIKPLFIILALIGALVTGLVIIFIIISIVYYCTDDADHQNIVQVHESPKIKWIGQPPEQATSSGNHLLMLDKF